MKTPQPVLKKKKWNQLSEWENQYIEMPVEDMVTLLVCGDFLEIKGLVKLMIRAIALEVNRKRTEEEIRKTYKIEDRNLLRQLHVYLDHDAIETGSSTSSSRSETPT